MLFLQPLRVQHVGLSALLALGFGSLTIYRRLGRSLSFVSSFVDLFIIEHLRWFGGGLSQLHVTCRAITCLGRSCAGTRSAVVVSTVSQWSLSVLAVASWATLAMVQCTDRCTTRCIAGLLEGKKLKLPEHKDL